MIYLLSLQEILQTQTIFLNNKTRNLFYAGFTASTLLCSYDPQPHAPQKQTWLLLW